MRQIQCSEFLQKREMELPDVRNVTKRTLIKFELPTLMWQKCHLKMHCKRGETTFSAAASCVPEKEDKIQCTVLLREDQNSGKPFFKKVVSISMWALPVWPIWQRGGGGSKAIRAMPTFTERFSKRCFPHFNDTFLMGTSNIKMETHLF